MKKVLPLLFTAVLAVTIVIQDFNPVSAETVDGLNKKINDLEKEQGSIEEKQGNVDSEKNDNQSKINENLNSQNSVEQEINTIDKELTETTEKITAKENEINKTNQQIEDLTTKIEELKNEIEKLKEEIIILKERIKKREELLKDRLRSIQENGGQMKYIQVIFGAQSFSDLISRTTAVNAIMDQDKTIMEELAADKKKLEEAKTEVESKKTEVESKKTEIEKQKQALEAKKQELVSLKGNLDKQMADKEKLMAELEEEHGQLEEIKLTIEQEQEILNAEASAKKKAIAMAQSKKGELEQLAREKAAREKAAQEKKSVNSTSNSPSSSGSSTPPASSTPVNSNATFIKPAAGPITSSYGMRYHPIYHYNRLHAGIDVGVGTGTALRAPADGVVSRASWLGSFGNVIMISHHIGGKNYTTVMAHLSSMSVSPGQAVSQGQVIGATGNTGGSTGPHLHFEVHLGGYGNPTNPLPYIR
ncbi:hypothetical protein CIL05_04795 [Virgibacillus profundi]|uniref:Uncharacterized protein n=1 Tax=Virgibacillus profundi TaxID=2024555 RepID=A0A2A2IGY8_9BACI|nr:M23 family metallopeptidase [Virgibacillus profundi]PAV31029.1 hypothetical protein CIL05_04795 [Virgibacillus profundi]PXY55215.1 hypothetical protein CIT14_04880 [Virgibacillus profundi]